MVPGRMSGGGQRNEGELTEEEATTFSAKVIDWLRCTEPPKIPTPEWVKRCPAWDNARRCRCRVVVGVTLHCEKHRRRWLEGR